MPLLLTLTHWFWWCLSPEYRRHLRHLRSIPDAVLFPDPVAAVSLVGGQLLWSVHPIVACEGRACCIHNPSRHHMAAWPQNWRTDRRMMERVCRHGIGHPDPDHMAWVAHACGAQYAVYDGIHGCDGCCRPSASSPDSDRLDATRYVLLADVLRDL